MELSAHEVRGLARHIGYGNPAAPMWFVGGEEGLGGKMSAREQAENLAARASWEPVMDIADAPVACFVTALHTLESGPFAHLISPRY